MLGAVKTKKSLFSPLFQFFSIFMNIWNNFNSIIEFLTLELVLLDTLIIFLSCSQQKLARIRRYY